MSRNRAIGNPAEGVWLSLGVPAAGAVAAGRDVAGAGECAVEGVAADLYVFADGSIMTPWAQGLYIMPGRGNRTLADLEGKTVAANGPDNTLYLLVAGVFADHGLSVSGVKLKSP